MNNPLLACAVGDTEWLKKCFSRSFDLSITDKNGLTCLHLATNNGHLECVRYLLDHCSLDVNQADAVTGQTALHFSLSSKCGDRRSLQLTKLLLEKGVDPNSQSKQGRTALHEAAGRGHTKCLKKLLEHKADITITDNHGRTACDVATINGRFECARLLRSMHWSRKKDAELQHDLKEKTEKKRRQQEREILTSLLKKEAADRAYEEWAKKKSKPVFKPPTACRDRQELKTNSTCFSCNSTTRKQSGRKSTVSHGVATIIVTTHQAKRNWEHTGKPNKLHPYSNYPPRKKRTTQSNRNISRKLGKSSSKAIDEHSEDNSITEELIYSDEIPDSEEQYAPDLSIQTEENHGVSETVQADNIEVQFLVGGIDDDEEDELIDHEENDEDIPFHDVGTANSFNSMSLPATLTKGRSIPEMMALFKHLGTSTDDSQQSRYRMRRRSFSCGRRLQRRFSLSSIPEGQMVKNYSSESMGSNSSWLRVIEAGSRSSEGEEEEEESCRTEGREESDGKIEEENNGLKNSVSDTRTLKVVNLVWDKASSSVQTNITESPMTPLNHSLQLLPATPPSPRHFSTSSSSSTPQHSSPSSPSPSTTPPIFYSSQASSRPLHLTLTHHPLPLYSTELEDVQEVDSSQKLDLSVEDEIKESPAKNEHSQFPPHSLFGSLLGGLASKSMVSLATVEPPTTEENDILDNRDIPQQSRRRIKSAPDIYHLHQALPATCEDTDQGIIHHTPLV